MAVTPLAWLLSLEERTVVGAWKWINGTNEPEEDGQDEGNDEEKEETVERPLLYSVLWAYIGLSGILKGHFLGF